MVMMMMIIIIIIIIIIIRIVFVDKEFEFVIYRTDSFLIASKPHIS